MDFRQRLLLVGLPVLINSVSFAIFFPLFTPGSNPTHADFKTAGLYLATSLIIIELLAVFFVFLAVRRNNQSFRHIFFDRGGFMTPRWYVFPLVIAGTLVAGWLFIYAQKQSGIVLAFESLTPLEKLVWYLLVPLVAAFCEEVIWRGYLQDISSTKRIIYNSISFALIHGIFSPIVLVATFIQGIIWALLRKQTNSTLPGMSLHLLSRYLALVI